MSAFYTLDRELRILSANPTTLGLWGRSASEVLGRKLTELFPNVDGGEVHLALLEAQRTLRPARLKTHSVTYNGLVEVEIYPLDGELQVRFGPLAGASA